jgi:hypothetical protein
MSADSFIPDDSRTCKVCGIPITPDQHPGERGHEFRKRKTCLHPRCVQRLRKPHLYTDAFHKERLQRAMDRLKRIREKRAKRISENSEREERENYDAKKVLMGYYSQASMRGKSLKPHPEADPFSEDELMQLAKAMNLHPRELGISI